MDVLNPAYNLGFLKSGAPIDQIQIDSAQSKGADFLAWHHVSINQAGIDLAHANGMEVHAWTVNGSARMQELIDWGIDGILTDQPTTLWALLPAADFNNDNKVDGSDLTMWQTNFGDANPIAGDADRDGDSDGADFLIWQREFGFGVSSSTASVTVPEPSTGLMLVIVLVLGQYYTARLAP